MMEYGRIAGIDKPISRVVQGTAYFTPDREAEAFALLDAVWQEGCTTFDTAFAYGHGLSERLLGKWIRDRGVRDQAVVISKGVHPTREERQRVTPHHIQADLNGSFENLGFDYIDVYLLHRDDPAVPVGSIVEKLNELHAAGKIGVFGGSNWSVERVREANEYAAAHNLVPFGVSSPNLSLAVQRKAPWEGCLSIAGDAGKPDRDWYAAQNMPLFTWSSLAGGFFSGRYRRDNLDSFTHPVARTCIDAYAYEANFQRLDRAEQMAKERGVSLAQVALAYVLSQPLNIYAIVGSETADEYRANAAALALKLTPAEVAWLETGAPEPA